jgi:DNA-binding SARP family transcriptional activator
MRTRAYTLTHALAALLALGFLGLLWQLRPGLPELPEAGAPMSSPQAEELCFWIAWLTIAGLLLWIAHGLLNEIILARQERRELEIEAFAERVLPKPITPPPPPTTLPAYPTRYIRRLPPRIEPAAATALEEPPAATAQAHALEPSTAAAQGQDEPRVPSVSVLGSLKIDGLKQPLKRNATREIIAYLALHPEGATRDELLEAIWPGEDPQRTLPRFWQSVTDARKALGDGWVRDGERYELDHTHIHIDLDQLDQLLTTSDPAEEQQALEAALALWHGQPLAGSDYPWADGDIHRLHATLLELLGRVGAIRLAAGDPRGALQAAEQAIALDHLHEPSWRLALQADHALGLRSTITKRYDALAHLLDEQLGLQPSHETKMIYRQLLGQN